MKVPTHCLQFLFLTICSLTRDFWHVVPYLSPQSRPDSLFQIPGRGLTRISVEDAGQHKPIPLLVLSHLGKLEYSPVSRLSGWHP